MIKSGLTAEDLTPGLRVDRIVEPQDQTPIGERTRGAAPQAHPQRRPRQARRGHETIVSRARERHAEHHGNDAAQTGRPRRGQRNEQRFERQQEARPVQLTANATRKNSVELVKECG